MDWKGLQNRVKRTVVLRTAPEFSMAEARTS